MSQAVAQFEQIIAQSRTSPSETLDLQATALARYIQQEGGYSNWILGDVKAETLTGTAADDQLFGLPDNDVLNGENGNDTLDGGMGSDTLYGGRGNDIYYGDAGEDLLEDSYNNNFQDLDTLDGGAGNDTLKGGGNDDTYIFKKGYGQDVISDYGTSKSAHLPPKTVNGGDSDTLVFGSGITRNNLSWSFDGKDLVFSLSDSPEDRLTIDNYYSSYYRIENIQVESIDLTPEEIMTSQVWKDDAGIDSLNWSASAISFNGKNGDDTITSGDFDDSLWGGNDNDSLTGNGGADTLRGGAGNDTLNGGADNDRLHGDGGDDSLVGGDGDDTLGAWTGNDTLYGGRGNDIYYGGAGEDLLEDSYNNNLHDLDTLDGGAGNDTLKGGGNDDTYIFKKGYGQDIISDYGTSKSAHLPSKTVNGGNNDTLIFGSGITRDNLTWNFEGQDLVFSLSDSPNDRLTIQNYSSANYYIENIWVENNLLNQEEIVSEG